MNQAFNFLNGTETWSRRRKRNNKVVVRISGGLGNQMFRHIAALALAQQTGRTLNYDLSDFLIFHNRTYQMREFSGPSRIPHWAWPKSALYLVAYILYKRISKPLYQVILRLLNVHRVAESSPWSAEPDYFNPLTRASGRVLYIDGNCQHLEYLPDEATVRNEFTFVNPPNERNRLLLEQLGRTESVSVHIRRSDYLSVPNAVLRLNYYSQAAELIRSRVPSPQWVVFSDDIPWCRTHVGFLEKAVFVEGNGEEPCEDLRLMIACKHHIIANSTFSWWGAYLGRDATGITVAPEYWFEGIPTGSCLLKKGWERVASF